MNARTDYPAYEISSQTRLPNAKDQLRSYRQASASRSEELDALIRRIDQRIAVLEKEEAEERARQASGCAAGAKEGE